MIKKILVAAGIVVWVMVTVLAVGSGVMIIQGGAPAMREDGVPVKTKNLPCFDNGAIRVSGHNYKIELSKTDGNEIVVSQYGSNIRDDELFTFKQTGDVTEIAIKSNMRVVSFDFFWKARKLVIEIPESFSGTVNAETDAGGVEIVDSFEWNEANLKTTSGGIRISNSLTTDKITAAAVSGGVIVDGTVKTNEIAMKTTSGGIRILNSLTADKITAEAVSGGVTVDGLVKTDEISLKTTSGGIRSHMPINTRELKASTTSGGIRMESIIAKQYTLNSSSGGINVVGISGGGSVKTNSGGVRMTLTDPTGEVKVTTTSGGIRLSIHENLSFRMDAKTTSGGIRGDFLMNKDDNSAMASIGENPVVDLVLRATSGGIRVEYE